MRAKTNTVAKKKPSAWYLHHQGLPESKKLDCRTNTCKACEWSQSTFYLKMKNPESLKNWEKNAVAQAYGQTPAKMFPEPRTKARKKIAA